MPTTPPAHRVEDTLPPLPSTTSRTRGTGGTGYGVLGTTPVVGPAPLANLWLATGHGTLGWTMAAGTGRLLADWMGTGKPEIDVAGLTIERYGARGGWVAA